MTTKSTQGKSRKEHETWCAMVIAVNAELPWDVECDCLPKKGKVGKKLK